MIVIIDVQELVNDPYAQRRSWEWLRGWTRCEQARIIVPRIVVDEAVRQFRRSLEETGRLFNQALKRIGKLLPESDYRLPSIRLDDEEDRYRDNLAARLRELGMQQADAPDIALMHCPDRSVKRAVIWQMVLGFLAGTSESVAIITDRARDFGKPGALAADLSADLEQRRIPVSRVRIHPSLFAFVKGHVQQRLKEFDALVRSIRAGSHPAIRLDRVFSDYHSEVVDALSEFIEGFGELPGHFNTNTFDSPHLVELSEVPEQWDIDAWQSEDGRLTVFVRYGVDGVVRCRSKDVEAPGEGFSGRLTFDVQVSIVFDLESGDVEDFEIGDLGYELWRGDWPGFEEPDDVEEDI